MNTDSMDSNPAGVFATETQKSSTVATAGSSITAFMDRCSVPITCADCGKMSASSAIGSGPVQPRRRPAVTRLVVLKNPTAGRGRHAELVAHALGALGGPQRTADVLTAPDRDAALATCRRTFADGVDCLVAVGGDGTAHVGLQAVAGIQLLSPCTVYKGYGDHGQPSVLHQSVQSDPGAWRGLSALQQRRDTLIDQRCEPARDNQLRSRVAGFAQRVFAIIDQLTFDQRRSSYALSWKRSASPAGTSRSRFASHSTTHSPNNAAAYRPDRCQPKTVCVPLVLINGPSFPLKGPSRAR
jgi:Diacylglycerol kinase catalytic domain